MIYFDLTIVPTVYRITLHCVSLLFKRTNLPSYIMWASPVLSAITIRSLQIVGILRYVKRMVFVVFGYVNMNQTSPALWSLSVMSALCFTVTDIQCLLIWNLTWLKWDNWQPYMYNFQVNFLIYVFNTSSVIAPSWMPRSLIDIMSTLIQVLAFCLTAPNHYLSQCCHRASLCHSELMSPYSLTGDPLHSRAACTQPCNVNTHSRAHCSPGARLCEQWGHGCVNNWTRLCASARLCRGSPVSLASTENLIVELKVSIWPS